MNTSNPLASGYTRMVAALKNVVMEAGIAQHDKKFEKRLNNCALEAASLLVELADETSEEDE